MIIQYPMLFLNVIVIVNFTKDISLPFTNKGKIHMISDIVTWANNKNIESEGVIQLDLRNKISTILQNM